MAPQHLNADTYDARGTLDNAAHADKVETFEAGGAIPVGSPVVIDPADNTGKSVIVGAAATAEMFQGVYEGVGGTGAVASSPLTGRAAVTGNHIKVRWKGLTTALVDGTTDVADGAFLAVGAGAFIGATPVVNAEYLRGIARAMEAQTADAATPTLVYLL